jgi:diaminopimelate decarboxylase
MLATFEPEDHRMDKLWPNTSRMDEREELWIGGCAASTLAQAHGTPLYVFDEETLRTQARAYRDALRRHYPGTAQAAYASKAYLCTALAQLFAEEGLDLDVVSGGELYVALRAGFPPERIHFHGNNKSREELTEALAAKISRIVVDNFYELEMLAALAGGSRTPALAPKRSAGASVTHHASRFPIWLRLSPGIQAHTHSHIQTGHLDTKFGFPIATGDAERAVAMAMQSPGLELVGLHCHIGSQIYEPETLADAAAVLIAFAAEMRDRHGFILRELSPGGGWGVPMTEEDPEALVEPYVAALAAAIAGTCRAHGLDLPRLVLEPGRSLVARAAVALYTVGATKEIPGVRTYVSVDGGMADNIRPALYGAKYAARAAGGRNQESGVRSQESEVSPQAADSRWQMADGNKKHAVRSTQREVVTLAGKFCESGDVLIRDIELPRLEPGDLLAVPMAGAYTLSMASNYNLSTRPAVVLVGDGQARLIQRRETYEDLVVRDVPLERGARHFEPPRGAAGVIETTGTRFYKYDALGNDYIVLDPADWLEPPSAELVRRICDRHRGVGADGVLWGPTPLNVGTLNVQPFALRLFNPDGGEFEKSGNGLRIFARYLWDRRLPAGPDFDILTPGGPVTAHVLDAEGTRIAMEMGQLSFRSSDLGIAGPPREVIDEEVTVEGRKLRIVAATIGNPHCVVFLDAQTQEVQADLGDLTAQLAHRLGPPLELLPLFPNRTNVQFAQAGNRHTLRIEIWERGAGYTLASGTSSCAAAGAAIRTGRCESPVTVQMPGGEMLVEVIEWPALLATEGWSVRLTGTVEPVCSGELGMGGQRA